MEPATVISLVGILIGGGGLTAAIVAIVKLRPEAGQIIVNTAETTVKLQSQFVDDLQEERHLLKEQVEQQSRALAAMETRLAKVEETARAAEARTQQLESENTYLKKRVSLLEAENIELRERFSIVTDHQPEQEPEGGNG